MSGLKNKRKLEINYDVKRRKRRRICSDNGTDIDGDMFDELDDVTVVFMNKREQKEANDDIKITLIASDEIDLKHVKEYFNIKHNKYQLNVGEQLDVILQINQLKMDKFEADLSIELYSDKHNEVWKYDNVMFKKQDILKNNNNNNNNNGNIKYESEYKASINLSDKMIPYDERSYYRVILEGYIIEGYILEVIEGDWNRKNISETEQDIMYKWYEMFGPPIKIQYSKKQLSFLKNCVFCLYCKQTTYLNSNENNDDDWIQCNKCHMYQHSSCVSSNIDGTNINDDAYVCNICTFDTVSIKQLTKYNDPLFGKYIRVLNILLRNAKYGVKYQTIKHNQRIIRIESQTPALLCQYISMINDIQNIEMLLDDVINKDAVKKQRNNIINSNIVMEPMCGSGNITSVLNGYKIYGIEIDSEKVSICKDKLKTKDNVNIMNYDIFSKEGILGCINILNELVSDCKNYYYTFVINPEFAATFAALYWIIMIVKICKLNIDRTRIILLCPTNIWTGTAERDKFKKIILNQSIIESIFPVGRWNYYENYTKKTSDKQGCDAIYVLKIKGINTKYVHSKYYMSPDIKEIYSIYSRQFLNDLL